MSSQTIFLSPDCAAIMNCLFVCCASHSQFLNACSYVEKKLLANSSESSTYVQ